MKRMRLAVLALATALLLAGCSEIPTTGPVKAGSTEEPNGTSIVYLPNPPASGASPREIVSGFLTAASAGDEFTVAKDYLTSAFAKKWAPRASVLVQEAAPTYANQGNSDWTVTVPVTARVDGDGVFKPRSSAPPLHFHLTQRNGQWRIDSAPDGIVLAQTVFQRLFKPQPLEFFDQSWSRLVPDLRWFPVPTGSTTVQSKAIVDQLVRGPAGPVAGGVTSNALAGAKVQAVDSESSPVTTVALSVPERNPSTETTDRMQQQLIQSLKLGTPSALRLVVNSTVAPALTSLVSQVPAQSAYVVADGQFGALAASGAFTPDGALGKRITAQHPQAVTVSERQGLAAVWTDSQQVVIVSATGQRRVDAARTGLIAPTMDQRSWVYSVPADAPNGIVASNAKGQSIALVSTLPGSTITSIEVSPDGTRMLVLVQSASGPQALVAGIQRRADGTPTGLTDTDYPVDLDATTGTGIGATWVDDGNVAVLVSVTDPATDRVWLQQLGGIGSVGGEIPGASSVVGTSAPSDLRVRLQNGDLFVSNDQQQWQEESATAPKVSVLAVQR